MMGIGRLVVSLKSKLKALKPKKCYDKVDKSESMRIEIRSKKRRSSFKRLSRLLIHQRTKLRILVSYFW
ncbi:hypothetical protein GIB67_036233 [Kingdonia uniflora]|uniref:Uncharacterized protein n=1 Tax=Kingdonia uniflora TaxID=39325 RepID=A0A7J7NTH8_9MAGN|nr:hypothetical protein GIB67_036233 [Kingdonia uniflora]